MVPILTIFGHHELTGGTSQNLESKPELKPTFCLLLKPTWQQAVFYSIHFGPLLLRLKYTSWHAWKPPNQLYYLFRHVWALVSYIVYLKGTWYFFASSLINSLWEANKSWFLISIQVTELRKEILLKRQSVTRKSRAVVSIHALSVFRLYKLSNNDFSKNKKFK